METNWYELFCNKIKNKEPFAFSRWGDGEWLNVAQTEGKNCDGNIYYPDLGEALKQIVLEKQSYYLGKQNCDNLFTQAGSFNQDWIPAEVFHRASGKDSLQLLFDALMEIRVVYIGNIDLKPLPFINEFIEIPPNNVWLIRDSVEEQIVKTMTEPTVYLFSAGMATNVFIHNLWSKFPEHSYIDVGSVFDPYVGKRTRRYHEKILQQLGKI
jgi:hypothetical protein